MSLEKDEKVYEIWSLKNIIKKMFWAGGLRKNTMRKLTIFGPIVLEKSLGK